MLGQDARRLGDRFERADGSIRPDFQLDTVEIGPTSQFGSGGMGRKITAARIAGESGVGVVICNGTTPGTLLDSMGTAEAA